jgi:hypothetical protein
LAMNPPPAVLGLHSTQASSMAAGTNRMPSLPLMIGTGEFLSQKAPLSAPGTWAWWSGSQAGLWAWRTTIMGRRLSSCFWDNPLPASLLTLSIRAWRQGQGARELDQGDLEGSTRCPDVTHPWGPGPGTHPSGPPQRGPRPGPALGALSPSLPSSSWPSCHPLTC